MTQCASSVHTTLITICYVILDELNLFVGRTFKEQMAGFLPPLLLSGSYLCVPSRPSQPQEGPGSPKHWCYLCAPHLCPPLCRNLAHPTKGNRWCTTVHGMTSVSVGRELMVNTGADACHVPPTGKGSTWWWWWCSDTKVISKCLIWFKSAIIGNQGVVVL